VIVLGIDPGFSTGYACIEIVEKRVKLIDAGVIKGIPNLKDLMPLIERADFLVIEDFFVRPQDAHKLTYQELPAPEAIGVLKFLAETVDHPPKIQMQSPSTKPVGYGWSGQKYQKGKKGLHSQDAFAHAVYYAVKNSLALPV
jgi:hypothetical protein